MNPQRLQAFIGHGRRDIDEWLRTPSAGDLGVVVLRSDRLSCAQHFVTTTFSFLPARGTPVPSTRQFNRSRDCCFQRTCLLRAEAEAAAASAVITNGKASSVGAPCGFRASSLRRCAAAAAAAASSVVVESAVEGSWSKRQRQKELKTAGAG